MKESLISEIIHTFYDTVKIDVMIGYHFRFIEDFDEHIPRIADFWNLQFNGVLKNKSNLPFNLLKTHSDVGIKKAELGRWMTLFNQNLKRFQEEKKISQSDYDHWQIKLNLFKTKIETIL